MDRYTKRTSKLTVAQKISDLFFAGPAPLDKASKKRAARNDAEVAAVFAPIKF